MRLKTEGLDLEQLIARIADFHGHLGPYVLFGFRAGQLALRELGAKGYFDLEADVLCGTRPPLSCFADGVQLGSGCTAGKGNLRLLTAEREPAAVVTFRRRAAHGPVGQLATAETGGGQAAPGALTHPAAAGPLAAVTIRIRPGVEATAKQWLSELGDAEAARRQLALADDEVFDVTRVPAG